MRPFKYQPCFLLHGHAPPSNINPPFSYTALRSFKYQPFVLLHGHAPHLNINPFFSHTAMRPFKYQPYFLLHGHAPPFKYQPCFLLHCHAPPSNINPPFSYTAMRPFKYQPFFLLHGYAPPSNTKPTFSYTAMRPFKYQPCFHLHGHALLQIPTLLSLTRHCAPSNTNPAFTYNFRLQRLLNMNFIYLISYLTIILTKLIRNRLNNYQIQNRYSQFQYWQIKRKRTTFVCIVIVLTCKCNRIHFELVPNNYNSCKSSLAAIFAQLRFKTLLM